jgi:predicted lipoprotein with Yx(FWY)xxD motif
VAGSVSAALVPFGVLVAVAACGSSGPQTLKSASHPHMAMKHHMATKHSSAKMAMHETGGRTAASMARMVAPHAEVTVARSIHYGNVLYDRDHFVLYVFSADRGPSSTCYGACAKAWPPMLTKGAPTAAGLNPSLLGTTMRHDGSLQVTYGGHPLYYWSGDTTHTIMCQHVNLHGGFWYLVSPNGRANMAKGVGTMSAMS